MYGTTFMIMKEYMDRVFDRLLSTAKAIADIAIESKAMLNEYTSELNHERMNAASLMERLHDMEKENEAAHALLQDTKARLKKASTELAQRDEDLVQFKKVSHVIAIERENNKLRKEIIEMSERLNVVSRETREKTTHTTGDSSSACPHKVVSVVKTEEAVEPLEVVGASDGEDDIEVFEKKFNRTAYYVTNDDKLLIFRKTEAGEIGECVGHCVRDGAKLIPKWID